MVDNQFIRTAVPLVRTLSGCALGEAWYARKLTTRLMQLSLYPLELLGAARADVAVGISRNTNQFFPGVHRVIPQGIDREVFAPGHDKSDVPAILFVGHGLRDRKRAYLLLDAFRRVIRPAVPTAELWLVCDDEVELPGVRHFRKLPIERLAELYCQAWVFCLPSSYEGFGRPYAEAMAAGTPVVATPNAGAREVLEDGRYGVLTPPSALGEALLALLRDRLRREQLATAGLVRAQEFDWEHVVSAYEQLYTDAWRAKYARKRPNAPGHSRTANAQHDRY
jgi:glycosyltransferase involved in cell wall biosynthesis